MTSNVKRALLRVFRAAYRVLARTPLRKLPGMFALARVFLRMFWPKSNIVSIQGFKMFMDIKDPNPNLRKTFQTYAMNLIHEEVTTKLFRERVKEGDVVVDLGANIGYFTLLAATLVGPSGKVFAFEPEHNNFKYLKKNIEVNGFTNVSAFQKAASNANGKTNLYICDYDSGHHTINQSKGIEDYSRATEGNVRSVEIDTVKLDDFLKDKTQKVNVIKMDVEGAEALALEGMREILTKNNRLIMFSEIYPLFIEKMGSSPKDYARRLVSDFGLTVYAIGHDYGLENSDKDLIKINDYQQLLEMVAGKEDHINLLASKG